jgi:hypothetical protein
MHIDVGSPYNCAKIAMRYALGSIDRPALKDASYDYIVFQNNTEELIFKFPQLNYSYVNKLPIEDISTFDQEEYGKFFYEYGRTLFANLIVAITRLDWYAVGKRANDEYRFVSEYYDSMLKLNDKVSNVLDSFCETLKIKRTYPAYNFLRSSIEIIRAKEENGFSTDFPDMKNTEILVHIYTAMWFSIVGYLLLFCNKTDIDGMQRFSSIQNSEIEVKTLIESIANSQEDDSKKINICSLLFTFYIVNRYYLATSGLTSVDPLLNIVAKISHGIYSLLEDEEDFIIIDNDLIEGVPIAKFTDKYDILDDIEYYQREIVLANDITNIWAFGKEYVFMHDVLPTDDPDYVPLENFIEPCLTKYIKINSRMASYTHSDNINIEKSFLYITNIINGIERDRIGAACPGTILHLTLIASVYRTIEKSSGYSNLPKEKKIIVSAGIDIIDTLIVVLYKLWFLSGKYFTQPKRPRYTKNIIGDTLEELRGEVLLILEEYFEFVHYRNNKDDPKYHNILHKRLLKMDNLSTKDIVNDFFKAADQGIYVTEAVKHGIYTIAYSALCNGIDENYTIEGLGDYSRRTEIAPSIIRKLSGYEKGVSKEYTKIPLIDAMMNAYEMIKQHIDEKPENAVITIYLLLYNVIEELLIKNSVGNYFEFNNAENLTTSYKVESIVSELIRKPLQVSLGSQDS